MRILKIKTMNQQLSELINFIHKILLDIKTIKMSNRSSLMFYINYSNLISFDFYQHPDLNT